MSNRGRRVLRAERVTRHLGDRPIIAEVSLTIEAGEWVSLVGASGCGKTTLLMLLGLIDRPDKGQVWLDDENTAVWSQAARALARLQRIGFVFQRQNLFEHLTTRDNVALPAWRAGGSRAAALRDADVLLKRFGLDHQSGTRASLLSAGEAQRAAIARALINRPGLVLADEPTGSLDSANAAQVLDALSEVAAHGAALLLATHDPTVAARGRKLAMRDGQLTADEVS